MTTKKEQFKLLSNKGKINHTFFGELDLVKGLGDEIDLGDGIIVLWEKEINNITTTILYDSAYECNMEILDTFAKFLVNMKVYLRDVAIALVKYLVQDNYYIVFHKEEVGLDVPSDIAEFVSAMTINEVILWIGENHITLDFMINPDESDEILCVRMNDKLEVVSIAWES